MNIAYIFKQEYALHFSDIIIEPGNIYFSIIGISFSIMFFYNKKIFVPNYLRFCYIFWLPVALLLYDHNFCWCRWINYRFIWFSWSLSKLKSVEFPCTCIGADHLAAVFLGYTFFFLSITIHQFVPLYFVLPSFHVFKIMNNTRLYTN